MAIPANSDATITAVKRYARSRRGGIPLFTADRRIGTGRKGVQLHPAQGSQAKRLARGDESTRSALDRAEALLRNADAVAGRQANISGRTALKLAAAGVFTLRDELDDLAERVEGIERGQR